MEMPWGSEWSWGGEVGIVTVGCSHERAMVV